MSKTDPAAEVWLLHTSRRKIQVGHVKLHKLAMRTNCSQATVFLPPLDSFENYSSYNSAHYASQAEHTVLSSSVLVR